MEFKVVGIVDPLNRRFFHVGFSGPNKRLLEVEAGDTLSELRARLDEIREDGYEPVFVVLETQKSEATALEARIFWRLVLASRSNDLIGSTALRPGPTDRPTRGSKLTPEERRRRNIVAGRPRNSHLPWSPNEDKLIREMVTTGAAFRDIIATLERSSDAVTARMIRLGLIDQTDSAYSGANFATAPVQSAANPEPPLLSDGISSEGG